jgi:hypothetical protein
VNPHRLTLPIDSSDGLAMNATEARQFGALLRADFQSADPFPSIVIDDLLPEAVLQRAREGFPAGTRASDGLFQMGYAGQNKRQITPEDCGQAARELFWFFNSRAMLQFLEGLTGIEGLLPDPYFVGGGYHETTRGGLLGVHADFRIHEQLHLQRRLNLIVYLNDTWDDAWKGQLELWRPDMSVCVARISPLLNRCVVFQTDAHTWHGHPDALETPEGQTRRSMALYYYTASRGVYGEVPLKDTVYMARAGDSAEVESQAKHLRFWETLRDWTPPAVFREIQRRRWRWQERSRAARPGPKRGL